MQSTDWLSAGISVVGAAATASLVFYAAATIREARRDRKKNTIKRMLESIYFPMLQILDRARNEVDRAMVRTVDSLKS